MRLMMAVEGSEYSDPGTDRMPAFPGPLEAGIAMGGFFLYLYNRGWTWEFPPDRSDAITEHGAGNGKGRWDAWP